MASIWLNNALKRVDPYWDFFYGGSGDRRDLGQSVTGGRINATLLPIPIPNRSRNQTGGRSSIGIPSVGQSTVVVVDSAGVAQVIPVSTTTGQDSLLSKIIEEAMGTVGDAREAFWREHAIDIPNAPPAPIPVMNAADQWAADLIKYGTAPTAGQAGVVKTQPPPQIPITNAPQITSTPPYVAPQQLPNPGLMSGSGGGEVATDWGDLLGNLASTYVNARFAPQATPAILPALPAIPGAISGLGSMLGGLGLGAGIGELMDSGGLGLPGFDVVGTGDATKGKMYNPRTGKWVRCHRRRRKLLTDGDFKCLASLKTLTGNNDAFKAAVIRAVR